jgi:hypothetical protein
MLLLLTAGAPNKRRRLDDDRVSIVAIDRATIETHSAFVRTMLEDLGMGAETGEDVELEIAHVTATPTYLGAFADVLDCAAGLDAMSEDDLLALLDLANYLRSSPEWMEGFQKGVGEHQLQRPFTWIRTLMALPVDMGKGRTELMAAAWRRAVSVGVMSGAQNGKLAPDGELRCGDEVLAFADFVRVGLECECHLLLASLALAYGDVVGAVVGVCLEENRPDWLADAGARVLPPALRELESGEATLDALGAAGLSGGGLWSRLGEEGWEKARASVFDAILQTSWYVGLPKAVRDAAPKGPLSRALELEAAALEKVAKGAMAPDTLNALRAALRKAL